MLVRLPFTSVAAVCAPLFLFLFVYTSYFGDITYHYPLPATTRCHNELHENHTIPLNSSSSQVNEPPVSPTAKPSSRDPQCDSFPDTSNILLVMKTGATESFNRVPTQLMTMLKCLPEFLIFSDMEQHMAGYPIHDSLETVLEEAMKDNSDFDLYRRQKNCLVDQENCQDGDNAGSAGWNLDKYKNIHIAEKAYNMRPDYDWYIFVDADTYVLWPNLVEWMKQLNPKDKHYLGSVAMMGEIPFGHGGSGYIVSQAALKDLAVDHAGVANKYDMRAKQECCGDFLFALAMKETSNIPVKNVHPTINGEKPYTLPYGPSHWCHPITTMHHMNSEEISSFWAFEQRHHAPKNDSTPSTLLIKDIYTEYVAPKLKAKLEDWDNRSDDWYYIDFESPDHQWEDWRKDKAREEDRKNEFEKKAHLSFDDCRKACDEVRECFQFRWQDDCCAMSKSFSMGKPMKKESEEKKRSMSGWAVEKINKWISSQADCKVQWPKT